jgi:hypothetical protein
MPTTTLISADNLKARLSLGDLTEISQACTVVVDLVTQTLERRIKASFAQLTREDTFRILSPMRSGTESRAVLMLRSGFVTGTPVVKLGDSPQEASDADGIDDAEYTINSDTGVVEIRSDTDLRNRFAAVEYTSGFAVNANVYTGIPEWLESAAYAEAAVQYYSLYPQYKPDNISKDMLDNWRTSVKTLLSGRTRYGGTAAVYPI